MSPKAICNKTDLFFWLYSTTNCVFAKSLYLIFTNLAARCKPFYGTPCTTTGRWVGWVW